MKYWSIRAFMDKFVSHHVDVKFVGKEKTKQKMFHKIGFGSFS